MLSLFHIVLGDDPYPGERSEESGGQVYCLLKDFKELITETFVLKLKEVLSLANSSRIENLFYFGENDFEYQNMSTNIFYV